MSVKNELPPVRTIPNLFNEFQDIQKCDDLETLTTFLTESPLVTNSFMFYDAVLSWLYDKQIDLFTPFVEIPDSFVEKFCDIMTSRGWSPLPTEYIDSGYKRGMGYFGGFSNQILKRTNMVTETQYKLVVSTIQYTADELFGRNHDIKFKFKPDVITHCSKEGECGFILRVTAAADKQDDLFNIQLVIDPDLYPEDLHLHEEVLSLIGSSHLCLDLEDCDNDWEVTWYGKPCRDGTNKYWCWGAYKFYMEGEGEPPPGHQFRESWYRGDDDLIRVVVYLRC